jgi:uncharacterized protein VirK/YbjX
MQIWGKAPTSKTNDTGKNRDGATEMNSATVMAQEDASTVAVKGLLGPISSLIRQRKTWSPRLLGILWRAATNLGTIQKVRRLLKVGPFAEVALCNPKFGLKYLTQYYLARSFDVSTRASCFLHHHKRIHAALPDQFLREILCGEVPVYQVSESGISFVVTIGLSGFYRLSQPIDSDREGELSIRLSVENEVVYVLSFTIVPGWVVKSPAEEVILISRIQGLPGSYLKIRLATKTFHEVAPGAMLLAVLQGLALALGVGQIAGVSARDQRCYCDEMRKSFESAYDKFYGELGIGSNSAGFFLASIPIAEKPLSCIKRGHRLRTKEKRSFKREIMMDCARFLANRLEAPDAPDRVVAQERNWF